MEIEDLRFFDPHGEIRETKNYLRHWQQEGATYFLTFRLADSIPKKLRVEWETERAAWLRHHPKPWSPEIESEYHRRFSGAIERWLDAGYGACALRNPECSRIVTDTLRHFDGERYVLISSVVMPSHVHALFAQYAAWPLEKLLDSWKTFTSRQINAFLGQAGRLWQRDYFDRLVRDRRHFARCVRYIRRNPAKAKLREGEYRLYENELAREIEG